MGQKEDSQSIRYHLLNQLRKLSHSPMEEEEEEEGEEKSSSVTLKLRQRVSSGGRGNKDWLVRVFLLLGKDERILISSGEIFA